MILASLRNFAARRPYLTNVVVYSGLYTGAEFCQQVYKIKYSAEDETQLDYGSLAKCTILGSAIFPNILFFWYKWLDKTLPGIARSVIIKKVVLDVFLLTPVNIAVFYTVFNLLDGNLKDPFSEAQQKLWPTFKIGIVFWLPAQTLNFWLVPPSFRVAYVGCCTFVWANILCNLKKQTAVLA